MQHGTWYWNLVSQMLLESNPGPARHGHYHLLRICHTLPKAIQLLQHRCDPKIDADSESNWQKLVVL